MDKGHRHTGVLQTQRVRFCRAHEGLGIWGAEQHVPASAQSEREAAQAVQDGALAPEVLDIVHSGSWWFCGWFNLMPMPSDPQRVKIGVRLTPDAWGLGLPQRGRQAIPVVFAGTRVFACQRVAVRGNRCRHVHD
jgi:hypothetical protein